MARNYEPDINVSASARGSTRARRCDGACWRIGRRIGELLAAFEQIAQFRGIDAELPGGLLDRHSLANDQAYCGPVERCFLMIVLTRHVGIAATDDCMQRFKACDAPSIKESDTSTY